MKTFTTLLALGAIVGMSGGAAVAKSDSPLTISRDGGHRAHIFPTYTLAKKLGLVGKKGAPPPSPALIYHGGPIMQPLLRLFIIYWQPGTLQDGTASTMSSGYRAVEGGLVANYTGHPLASITTQYYQGSSSRAYVTGNGVLAANFIDTQPYPVSGCAASIGPNCFTDAQLRTEVQRVITSRGWTAGINAMFLFFTSPGEGSCFDNTTSECSTETANVTPQFCAYHSYFGSSPNYIVYSNEPYGNPSECLGSGTQPNLGLGGPGADPAATAASHEMTEAITDPLLNAWYDSSGSEIGDICAYNYGTNTYGANANQLWSGLSFELQTEYDNHNSTCRQVGP